ncbi:MAG: hypothetical protein Q9183_006065, partial [Haloplaca sp. 2 TL-2023]
MEPASFVAAEQAVSTTVEGAALAGYGLAQSTQPLDATYTRITSEAFLPRTHHTIAVVAGKAYIFGGEESPGKLADDNVHIMRLPSKKPANVGDPEYKCVPSLGQEKEGTVPGPRSGHTACVLGYRIYILGGKGPDGQLLQEDGKVWVFDTETLQWSSLTPSSETYPQPRYQHSCVASQHPLPNTNISETASYAEQIKSTVSKLPSLIGKASSPREPHGSIIICSGLSSPSSEPMTDTWTFTVATKTWSQLPSLPTVPFPPSLAIANNTLCALSNTSDLGSELQSLQLEPSSYKDARGEADLDLKPKAGAESWSSIPFPTNPLAPGPLPRKGAGMLPITTGNGRLYLLYFLGEKVSSKDSKEGEEIEYHSTAHTYQLPATSPFPAALKDQTRAKMGIQTGEGTWSEVKVVPNEEGGVEMEGKSHPGPRGWFASCAGNQGGE